MRSLTDTTIKPELSVRLVVADHYMSPPIPGLDCIYSEFRGADIKQVPTLRIFGPTPEGRKACVHVHGVFPYFYVPCANTNPDPGTLYQLASSLDKALNVSLKQTNSTNQHVYKISLVKGIPFYGYHSSEHLFYKIFLYSPNLLKQAVDLVQNGAIMGQTFQPYEAHLNFTLQFFIDFNLFGMSYVDFQSLLYRKKQESSSTFLSDESISLDQKLNETMCYYEADCTACHIMNRQRVGKGEGIENPGLEEVWKKENDRRKQLNLSLISKSLSQLSDTDLGTVTHKKFKDLFSSKLVNKDEKPTSPKTIELDYTYPAESLEGTQLSDIGDVSIHEASQVLDETLMNTQPDFDQTVVDESKAFSCSLSQHYSQISMDSEDMDLVDLLQDLDDTKVEINSILESQVPEVTENDPDDFEYTQVFDEERLMQSIEFKSPSSESKTIRSVSQGWEDSFWDGANISQLDGTCDEEKPKKAKKRKPLMRRVGLSKPKKKTANFASLILSSTSQAVRCDEEESDEIEASQIIELKVASPKKRPKIRLKFDLDGDNSNSVGRLNNSCESELIKNVHSPSTSNKQEAKMPEETIEEQQSPNTKCEEALDQSIEDILISDESDEQEMNVKNLGIKSFYDISHVFDLSSEESDTYSERAGKNTSDENILEITNISKSNVMHTSEDSCDSFSGKNKTTNFIVADKTKRRLDEIAQSDTDIPEINSNTNHEKKCNEFNDSVNKINLTFQNYGGREHGTSEDKPEMLINDDLYLIKNELASGPTYEEDFHLKYSDSESSFSENGRIILTPKLAPPTRAKIAESCSKYGITKINNPKPFYSNFKDVGKKIEVGEMVLKLGSNISVHQKPFECVFEGVKSLEDWRETIFQSFSGLTDEENTIKDLRTVLASNKRCILEPLVQAPFTKDVKNFTQALCSENEDIYKDFSPDYCDEIEEEETIGLNDKTNTPETFDVTVTPDIAEDCSAMNQSVQASMQPDGSFLCFGNVPSQNETLQEMSNIEHDQLTMMIMEVHCESRRNLLPDPAVDAIQAVFYSITNDVPENDSLPQKLLEIIVVDKDNDYLNRCGLNHTVKYLESEQDLLEYIFEAIKLWDPDIFCGYEIEKNSWGYFLERCQLLGIDILPRVSRVVEKNRQKNWKIEGNDYEGRIIGRVIFNVWRMLRSELALSSYSFESTMYNILKERVPCYSSEQLSDWWKHESKTLRWLPVEFYLTRVSGTLRMLQALDLINRTSELARLFGLQWWEVLSRGSQFRVESLMLRAARPLNLVALSPSVRQRAAMKAPEILPLIFEPESRFYSDPVIVLDFQSLYPSMMIAYNYCFSTCIGNIRNITGEKPYEFGAWRLKIPKARLENLSKHDLINWSPVGVGFVKPEVRRGVLPALLRRILAARQAVKKSMKTQTDEALKRAMHSRQLGLKLIANVTYGYTAANFSGRMPCVEVGDSVVSKGRETLERAIQLVKDNKEWDVKVVYGDTDSMFVLVPGANRAKAFQIGQEIADAVTADNPSPVLLKLEKVYQPCILQTKKRYVGFMYESADQKEPVYEAKGIETVRRDGCPAGVKLLQNSLCELFTSADMSRVKSYVCKVISDVSDGRTPVHELFMTREYNGASGYRPGAAAPPLEIARRMSSRDPRSCPARGWRVSWLVSAGPPQTPLVRLAKTPLEAARECSRPFALYYITRVLLPPLARCFSLVGQDVFQWYRELPRRTESGAGGIVAYMQRGACAVCGIHGTGTLCPACLETPQKAIATLTLQLRDHTNAVHFCQYICSTCAGHSDSKSCIDVECPVMWRRLTADTKLAQTMDNFRGLPAKVIDRKAIDF